MASWFKMKGKRNNGNNDRLATPQHQEQHHQLRKPRDDRVLPPLNLWPRGPRSSAAYCLPAVTFSSWRPCCLARQCWGQPQARGAEAQRHASALLLGSSASLKGGRDAGSGGRIVKCRGWPRLRVISFVEEDELLTDLCRHHSRRTPSVSIRELKDKVTPVQSRDRRDRRPLLASFLLHDVYLMTKQLLGAMSQGPLLVF